MANNHLLLKHKIIQWNINGFQMRRDNIQLLLDNHSPAALCIQETNLYKDQDFKYHKSYYTHTGTGHGGVGIIVKDKYVHEPIPLRTSLQAVAVKITLQNDHKYTLCSIYIPPVNELNVSKEELDDLKSQLPSPYILMGDFNAKLVNTDGITQKISPNGEQLQKLIEATNMTAKTIQPGVAKWTRVK